MSGKCRTPNDHFNVREMCDALTKFAKLKACPWDWEMSYYAKTRRSQGPDHAGLLRYVRLFAVLITFLPNGCPLPLQIKEVWMYLERHHQIMSASVRATGKSSDAWAMDVANTVCVAFHHLRTYRTSGTSFLSPEVMEVVNKISSPLVPSPSLPVKHPLPQQSSSSTARKVLKHDSASSVVICAVSCKCSECSPPVAITIESPPAETTPDNEEEDARSETSMAAEHNTKVAELKRFCNKKPAGAPIAHVPAGGVDGVDGVGGDGVAGLAIKVVKRKNPPKRASSYIMQNNKYLIGASKNQREDHEEIMDAMAVEITSSGHVWSKESAADWLSNH